MGLARDQICEPGDDTIRALGVQRRPLCAFLRAVDGDDDEETAGAPRLYPVIAGVERGGVLGSNAEPAPRFGRRYEGLGVVEGCALVVRELSEESDGRVVLLRQACAMAGQLRPLEIALGRV